MTVPVHDITERLTALAAPLVASLGLSVWGLEFIPGGRGIVRLYIEGEDGATIDQCADVSRLFGLALEVEDVIPDAYVLEVSSPGLERVFFSPEQLAPHAGSDDYFELSLLHPVSGYPGRKKFNGRLLTAEGSAFSLLPHDPGMPKDDTAAPVFFTWDEIKKIRRIHFVPAPEKPKKGKTAKAAPSSKKTRNPRAADSAAGMPGGDSAPNTGSGGSE